MKITEKEVKKIAGLARIKFQPEEITGLASELGKILEFIEELNEVETENISPTSHSLELKNVFREDIRKDSNLTDETLKNAPQKENNFFKVKKIIEG